MSGPRAMGPFPKATTERKEKAALQRGPEQIQHDHPLRGPIPHSLSWLPYFVMVIV